MTVSAQKPRDLSLDLGRGLAVLLMIQTHAFHGWVKPSLQAGLGFHATRWLGAFPLPSFLLLAGVAVALTVQRSLGVGASARAVRRGVLRRGLSVVAWGYAVNLAWGVIDGGRSLDAFLRAEVLQAIGWSLCVVALLIGGHDDRAVDVLRVVRRSIAGAWLVVGLTPWLTRLTRDVEGPWRYLIAPFSEVRVVTVMPVFPLAAWCLLGVVVGLWLVSAPDMITRRRRDALIGVVGVVALIVGTHATRAVSAYLDEPLSRASFALWPNAIEGAGRGLCVLALGAWLARALPPRAQPVLAGFGAASLVVYAVHVPFCYGRLAGELRGALSITGATPWVLLLMVASYGVVWLRERWRSMRQATWGRT